MQQPNSINSDQMTMPLEERFADAVVAKGLQVPAIFFIELYKPLATIGGSACEVFSPFLTALLGVKSTSQMCELVSSRERLERVLTMIEAKAQRT